MNVIDKISKTTGLKNDQVADALCFVRNLNKLCSVYQINLRAEGTVIHVENVSEEKSVSLAKITGFNPMNEALYEF